MAKIPINHFARQEANQDGTITHEIHSYPLYFINDQNQLEDIDTSFVASSDVGWDWEVKKGVYKLRVKNDGTFEVDHLGDKYSLKFLGLGFFNSDTKQRIAPAQTQVTLSNPTANGDTLSWSLPGGSSYSISYNQNQLRDVLTIGATAKNFLKNNKPAGWTVDNTWVGQIFDIDLSASTMIESNDIESDGDIQFVQNGRMKHRIRKGNARSSNYQDPTIDADGNVTNPTESSLSWPRRRIIKNGKYVVAIKANALDVQDNGTIIFNDTASFQEGVSGYSGTTDVMLNQDAPTTNQDTLGLNCPNAFSNHAYRNIVKFDLTSIVGPVTVSASSFDLRLKSGLSGDNCNAQLRRIVRSGWVENQATWNVYSTGNNWGSAGCSNTTTDIVGTDDGSASFSGQSTPRTLSFTNASALWEGFINGTWTNEGFLIVSNAEGDANGLGGDSEDGTASNRPKLSLTYTAGGGGGGPSGMMTTRTGYWGDL